MRLGRTWGRGLEQGTWGQTEQRWPRAVEATVFIVEHLEKNLGPWRRVLSILKD